MANTGTTAYPATLDDYTNVGTATYEDDSGFAHHTLHNQAHEAIESIESVVGTTAGTGVLTNFSAGDLAARVNNETFGTVDITGGTIRAVTLGTPTVTGGSWTTPTFNNATLGTPGLIAPTMTGLGTITGTINSNLTVADAQDIKFVSGAKIERVDGHVVITPETSKLVKTAVYRQDITTNTYTNNSVILTGWGYLQAGTTAAYKDGTVNFGVTFGSAPVVTVSDLGNIDSTPTSIASFNNWNAGYCTNIATYSITTTGFSPMIHMILNNGTTLVNFPNTRYYGYSWTAVGVLA